jgi:hypothetical protein
MTKESYADLLLLNGLLPVSSVFLPLFPICNFAFINIQKFQSLVCIIIWTKDQAVLPGPRATINE